jgi:Uma2 family endonuclease
MTVALRKPMSLEQFLAWEERQELRYEFDGFAPLAMTGGTLAHDEISGNVRATLRQRLGGTPCRPFGPNAKILCAGRVRYPDVLVTCVPQDLRTSVVQQPVVVFEVISSETARTDRIEKLREYRAAESIQRYVILEQTGIGAAVFARHGAGWIATALTEGDTLAMPELGIAVPLAEFYAGLEFPAEPEQD